jgi:hypothetical protein
MRLLIAGTPFAFRFPPQQTSKDTHKNLTLRLCSYINLFSCQISSYGLLPSLHRLGGYGLSWLPVLPLRAFTLQTIAQRKMELNADCSPDLSNDRRQNDVAGYRNLNNDGVVLTPSIGQLFLILPVFDSNPLRFGGADRDRTGDLLLAKQALSQLSYSPFKSVLSIQYLA